MGQEPVRVFTSESDLCLGAEAILSPEESHYLQHVHRARVGDEVTILDTIQERAWRGRVRERAPEAVLEIIGTHELRSSACRSRVSCLCLARTKGGTEDDVITGAVELGVEQILLWQAEHSVRKGKNSDSQLHRLERVVLAAARQSGKAWLPQLSCIDDAASLVSVLAGRTQLPEWRLLCSLDSSAIPLRDVAAVERAVVVVGPEGDISMSEHRLFLDSGFTPVSLGPFTLRVGTAAIAAISSLNTLFGVRS